MRGALRPTAKLNERQYRLIHRAAAEKSRLLLESSLAAFTKAAWEIIEPGTPLLWNWHLDTICGYLEAFGSRKIKRLIINVPPGSMKSILVSVMYPAWVWTREPSRRYLSVTNEGGLAIRDALRMRMLVGSEWYQERWPLAFQRNQDEKSLFVNSALGHRQSIGLNAKVTGKRGDDLLIDDPHDAKMAFSDVERANVIQAYDQGLSNRLNDAENSGICLIMQRLHQKDLTGHLLGKKQTQWVHLCIAMEYEGQTFDAGRDIGRPELNDPRTKPGELMFPERFGRAMIEAEKEDKQEYGWAGQYQQRPVPLGGGLLKSKWWRKWPKDKPFPGIIHIFESWDTAYSEADMKKSAHSARTRWGIFWNEQDKRYQLMLMSGWHGQVNYPTLLEKVIEQGRNERVNCQLIEKKASGISIVQSMKKAVHAETGKGHYCAPIRTYMPDRDKISRAYAVQHMLRRGDIWYPDRKWAESIIGYVSAFPNGMPPSADITDTCTQAWLYVQKGWWLNQPDDDKPKPHIDDDDNVKQRQAAIYG